MNLSTTIKAVALAAAVLTGTASASMAGSAVYAWADEDVYVFDKYWDEVDTLYEGEKVVVSWCKKGYCWIEHKGPDGFVKKSDLDFHQYAPKKHHYKKYSYSHSYDYDYDLTYCFDSYYGKVCVTK